MDRLHSTGLLKKVKYCSKKFKHRIETFLSIINSIVQSCLGHDQTAKILIDRGADVNSKNKDGQTPLHKASRYGNSRNIAPRFKHRIETFSFLFSGHDQTVKLLIGRGADVNSKDNGGLTALGLATSNSNSRNILPKIQEKKIKTLSFNC